VSRLGPLEHHLIPLNLFDTAELANALDLPRVDLARAAQRFRDGDLGGAIAAACGAADSAVTVVCRWPAGRAGEVVSGRLQPGAGGGDRAGDAVA
jgi:hypothetical protein